MFEVHNGLNVIMDTFPRSRASQEADWPIVIDDDPQDGTDSLPKALKLLVVSNVGVERCSFLPDDQRDRSNLPRQGAASHCWLHPLGKQSLGKIVIL